MVKTKDVAVGRNTRKSFAKITEVMDMPNLIEVQKKSYEQFMETGIEQALKDMGKITDFNGQFELSFETDEPGKKPYRIGEIPKYGIGECKKREATYAVPLYFTAKLLNKQTGEIKTSEIYIGEFPKMTDAGTFIINGAERVVISQLVRSPGVYFGMTHDKTGKELYTTTVIPNRGAWLEFETDQNDIFYVKIDKNKKIPITTFIRSLSFITGIESNEEILDFFGGDERIETTLKSKDSSANGVEALLAVYKNVRPGEPPTPDVAQTTIRNLFFDTRRYDLSKVGRYKYNKKLGMADRLRGHMIARPVISEDGELIADAGVRADAELAKKIEQAGVKSVWADIEGVEVKIITNHMCDASEFLPMFTSDELEAIGINDKVAYSVLQTVLEEIDGMEDKEEIKAVIARYIDQLVPNHITIDDIFASINYLNCTAHRVGSFDDIDHLGNRRIRCVGELLQNQLNIGLSNLSKAVREKFSLHTFEPDKLSPVMLVNTKVIISKIREFFGSSPLSQFMDQTNPLAELTHKRRLSALGPGGLSRDRAGFEVRDVHYSHYGRMCPIESPEGGNIGLISYLATFARINKYGFVEAPFRKVDKTTGKVLDEVVYMTADVEDEYFVAQANEELDENNFFVNDRVTCRCRSDFRDVDKFSVDYMDVSPRMVFSVATGMIPFLEHDDANRALMGANMQRQAVPLLKTVAPLVGTGMEYKAACDSGVCVLAKRAGTVVSVSAGKIVIKADEDGEDDVYELVKFMRSNASTCTNQKPIVNRGDKVKANEVIADGPGTCEGEVALGKNALIGFMTWEGYNYEDAVLLNERMVREDIYTSIHIDKYEVEARETKLGSEFITRDIPNVGEAALSKLDENGIIYIGAEVKDNDILVGKITPKAEAESTPEERLLRAIFGEKAKEFKDTSLRLPHGSYGIVIDVDTYTRENSEELGPGVNKIVRVYVAQKRKISVGDKMAGRHGNKGVVSRILPSEDMPFLEDGTPLDIVLNPLGVPSRMNVGQVLEVTLGRACRELGWKIMTPIFDGASEADIKECLRIADKHAEEKGNARIPDDGKVWLRDGRTGERFDNRITVGVMYFLKLHHLVDDKIHARSTGPYSLVTQQPLGGKAQFGGQRFGEMEVWALEAYGAAYTLQEILTVKSDDVIGRRAAFSAIVEGDNVPKPGIPESFKVLVKELQALGLDITAYDDENAMIDLTQDYDDDAAPSYTQEDLDKAQHDDESQSFADDDDESDADSETDELMNAASESLLLAEDGDASGAFADDAGDFGIEDNDAGADVFGDGDEE